MDLFNPYVVSIFVSMVIIVSYLFSQFSQRTNIPGVILLILLGIGIKLSFEYLEIETGNHLFEVLELLGLIGLIMIVLEAALDLKLTKEKRPLIIKSFLIALISLLISAFGIAWILNQWVINDFFIALVYAVPLSIMSSAIIIPSVVSLSEAKKEFLIYESTFSDILGIMFFYFLVGNADTTHTTGVIVAEITLNILITIVSAVILSYALVWLLQYLESKIKLFFLIAVLVLLYSVGKMFHLSSLIIIMIFGLILNNYKLFFLKKLAGWINNTMLDRILADFHIVTLESSFVIRTFFFVIFGMALDLTSLYDLKTMLLGVGITALLYVIRFIMLKISALKSILPELFIAPRGLITILLFFSIPIQLKTDLFNAGILLYTIILSSIIMSFALVFKPEEEDNIENLQFDDWEELDKEIESLSVKGSD